MPRKIVYTPKDVSSEEKIEPLMGGEFGSAKLESSPEDTSFPQKKVKVFKRVASSTKEGPYVKKERTKNGKTVSSISGKDESSLVDGEAKIG